MKRSDIDFFIVIGIFLTAYLIATLFGFNEHWSSWATNYSIVGFAELPFALSFLSFSLGWYAWRRLKDAGASHQQLSATIEKLKTEVSERKFAVEHAQLLTETKNEMLESEYLRNKKLKKIRMMGDALAAAATLDELQEISVKYLKKIIPDNTVAVFFANKAFNNWRIIDTWGEYKDKVYLGVALQECQVLQQGKPYVDSSNTQNMLCNNANLTTIKSVACYPIASNDIQYGVLHIRSDKLTESLLSREDEQRVIEVCNTIGLHFHNTQLRTELSMASNRDELTGLLNRRGLGSTLKREIQASQLQGYDVSLAMLDIDHFKKYNDSFGHAEGDKALRFVAEILAKNIRSRDVVARYGGEEFILVLPNTRKAEAHKKLKALIAKVAQESELSAECQRVITISVGLSTCPEDYKKEETLIKSADLALYAAKKRGRNCVVTYKKAAAKAVASPAQVIPTQSFD